VRCDEARPLLSAAFDAEPMSDHERRALDEHVRSCAACQWAQATYARVRQHLRFELVTQLPDVAPAVRARLEQPAVPATGSRGRWLTLAAAAIAGVVAGASLVSGAAPGRRPAPVAAELPARVLAAQRSLDALDATVTVVERGWHPQVGERRFTGTLRYRAPERIALELRDRTIYPSAQWVRNDVAIVVDGSRSWRQGPAACPPEAQPGCTPPDARTEVTTGRAPFDRDQPAPLDLVLPAGSFGVGHTATLLGTRVVDGRTAIGVAVTAAQLDPLLDWLRQAGNWRPIDPTLPAVVWLDQLSLVPLDVAVGASGAPVLEIELRHIDLSGGAASLPPAPAGGSRDAGFRDAQPSPSLAPRPTWLPQGMRAYRQGVLQSVGGPRVFVQSWSDGRAWIAIRSTADWDGGRLFGGLGDVVRPVSRGGDVVYVGGDGTVAVHASALDVVVSGSVPAADLRRVAAALGVPGSRVPDDWDEAATISVRAAALVLPGLLAPPERDDFEGGAARVRDGVVSVAYAGDGARRFMLTQSAGTALLPPLGTDATGLRVRGRTARYSPGLGALEWVEDGIVVELRSVTLSATELVGIATSLRPAR
jgi:hypothetical protein